MARSPYNQYNHRIVNDGYLLKVILLFTQIIGKKKTVALKYSKSCKIIYATVCMVMSDVVTVRLKKETKSSPNGAKRQQIPYYITI